MEERQAVSRLEMEAYFGPGGRLSECLPGFEHRREQVELAREVMRALARGDAGLFEAGTGTGKSLAYLIPAALYALESRTPVVISTYTISLQEQLLHKDIPIVQKIFPELRAVLVKGWRNYVCYHRLEAALEAPGELLDPEHDEELLKVAAWARESEDGTLSDLPFAPSADVWDEVCAESDSCLRSRCPYVERCPLFRDRAAMAKAHLVVVNHHLLMSDVAVRKELDWQADAAVLPAYEAVIVDEAHHLEDVATHHLGMSLSSRGAAQLFGRLYRTRGSRARGVVASLRRLLVERDRQEELALLEGQLVPGIARAQQALEAVFSTARRWPGQRIGDAEAAGWEQAMALPCRDALHELEQLASLLQTVRARLDPEQEESPAAQAALAQVDAAARRLKGLAAGLRHFSSLDTGEHVYWLEREGKAGEHVRLVRAPVEVGPHLAEWIGASCRSLVLVSATLSVGGSFRYFRERVGLLEHPDGMEVRQRLIASPFDYASQAVLGVVLDLPEPGEPAYARELPRAIEALVTASDGRALVLFTSFAMLEEAKRALVPRLREAGIDLLAQGEGPPSRLLQAFRDGGRPAVLFGTDSFWEGVDVPGEALSLVVLTRLPFDVPTEPVAAARAERIEAAGRSAFAEYSLPRAVLKLKQGFGRLIRTQSDRGAVVLCDRRVASRRYGRVFLDSLPPAARVQGSAEEVAAAVRRFLQGERLSS